MPEDPTNKPKSDVIGEHEKVPATFIIIIYPKLFLYNNL